MRALTDILDNDSPILILEDIEIYLTSRIQSIIKEHDSEVNFYDLYRTWKKDDHYDLSSMSDWLELNNSKATQTTTSLLNQLENCYNAIMNAKQMKKDQEILQALKITRDFLKDQI